jgi:hypothetical protein
MSDTTDTPKVLDIGNRCVECGEDTGPGSGRFVNRIGADSEWTTNAGVTIYVDGWMCAECEWGDEDDRTMRAEARLSEYAEAMERGDDDEAECCLSELEDLAGECDAETNTEIAKVLAAAGIID